jgi:UDP-N-acetylmuramoyl-tripeptide--D-alanyl-D-alanine ligase
LTTAARQELELAVRSMSGTLVQAGTRGTTFAGAAADSREVAPGQLFFAFPGERVDGYDFAAQAAAAGAAGLVIARGRAVPPGCEGPAVIAVDDPRRALGELASVVRAAFRGLVVGITGSNGKTTTKELVGAALGPLGPVLRTPGNRNTDVGLPLTILGASGAEASWVLEMAMRARGEIAALARIARPHVGVVTNVAAAHLETLGSIEEVARAKGEMFAGLGSDGLAVLPADDPLITAQVEAAAVPPARRLTFGARSTGDVRTLDFLAAGAQGAVVRYALRETPVVVRLPLAGAHNARNAGAALAVALGAGVAPLAAAAELARVELPAHRSAVVAAGGRMILDDCYNANPLSMRAALAAVLASAGTPAGNGNGGNGRSGGHTADKGRNGRGGRGAPGVFAILGDMLELGPDAETLHGALGREAGARLDGLVAVGAFAGAVIEGARATLPSSRAIVAASPAEAAAALARWTRAGDWILVKASRGLRLERAVEALQSTLDNAPEPRG